MIVVQTQTGQLPRYVAKYRPSVPILVCCEKPSVLKPLALCRGILTYQIQENSTDSLIKQVLAYTKEHNLCKSGRKLLYLHGMMEDRVDEFAMKEIISIE